VTFEVFGKNEISLFTKLTWKKDKKVVIFVRGNILFGSFVSLNLFI